MSQIKWIKILVDIFDDEAIRLIETMPDGDTMLIIWFKLLAKAGKINDGGLVYFKENIPYTEEMLSTVFKRPISTIRLALNTFIQFGLIELNDAHQILICNWEKHQNVAGMEQIREYNKLAKRKQRAKEKELKLLSCQGHVNDKSNLSIESHESDIDIDKEKEKENNNYYNDDVDFFGEYKNVGLNKTQYGKLLSMIMNQKKLDELIELFGKKIEIGKEQRFSYELPNAHFERLLSYWKYIKMNPQKFTSKKESEVPAGADNEILSLDDMFKSMGGK